MMTAAVPFPLENSIVSAKQLDFEGHVVLRERVAREDLMLRVLLLPGRDTPAKRYRAYFSVLLLDACPDPHVILCHSRGIDAALAHPSGAPIVAMDPSDFPVNEPRVTVFARRGRVAPEGSLNIHWYDEQTHHPYKVKRIRDAITHQLIKHGARCADCR